MPVIIWEVDKGAICLSQDPLRSGRTKHIALRFHHLGDLVRRKKVKIKHASAERQHADTLTRLLGVMSFRHYRNLWLNSRRESRDSTTIGWKSSMGAFRGSPPTREVEVEYFVRYPAYRFGWLEMYDPTKLVRDMRHEASDM